MGKQITALDALTQNVKSHEKLNNLNKNTSDSEQNFFGTMVN